MDSRGYYSLGVTGSLFQLYVLNTEIAMSAASPQTIWFSSELAAKAPSAWWNIVGYHRAMRPHTTTKSNGINQYDYWAPLIDQYHVNLVMESDSHLAKYTFPIKKSVGAADGLVRDDLRGTVYIGEGGWGAPLIANGNLVTRSFTRNRESVDQLHWLFVGQDKIEVRTVLTTGVTEASFATVNDSDAFAIPVGINLWEPSNGGLVTINQRTYPAAMVASPADGARYTSVQAINLQVSASSADSTIASVKFFVNGVDAGADNSTPFELIWTPAVNGTYAINALVTDANGMNTTTATSNVTFGPYSLTRVVGASADDAE